MIAICVWWFRRQAIHTNISSSHYHKDKLNIRKILSSGCLQYGTHITRFKFQFSLLPLPPHLIMNRCIIRHWYRIYHHDNECEISLQMAFPTNNEICNWLHIYGMASKQSRMCAHVWRPWKIHTNCLLQACNCYTEENTKWCATALQLLHWKTCKLLATTL